MTRLTQRQLALRQLPNCGYHTFCGTGISFISRYRDETDYCIAGERIRVYDDGTVRATCHDVTPEEIRRIELFRLTEYADYCRWHVEQNRRRPDWHMELQPFQWVHPLRLFKSADTEVPSCAD